VRNDWARGEKFAAAGAVLALLGIVTSVWNLPRGTGIVGLSMSALALAALGIMSVI
jgi:hypothetical protein